MSWVTSGVLGPCIGWDRTGTMLAQVDTAGISLNMPCLCLSNTLAHKMYVCYTTALTCLFWPLWPFISETCMLWLDLSCRLVLPPSYFMFKSHITHPNNPLLLSSLLAADVFVDLLWACVTSQSDFPIWLVSFLPFNTRSEELGGWGVGKACLNVLFKKRLFSSLFIDTKIQLQCALYKQPFKKKGDNSPNSLHYKRKRYRNA